jgi:hypothetical protein
MSTSGGDKYAVTEGHLLIIPNRHVADYFSVIAEEKTADTITSTNTESPKIGGHHQSTWRRARRDSRQGRLFEGRISPALTC